MALTLSSPAFEDGTPIPERYGSRAANVNPPLEIAGVPDDTVSLALLVDDSDAVEPAGRVWDHWLVWNTDPAHREIPENWDPPTARVGTTDDGEVGYSGPNPPDREHTYRFRLYPLEADLDLESGATKEELDSAMEGHVLEDARLEGTYTPA